MKGDALRPEDYPALEWWVLHDWLLRRRNRRPDEEQDLWPAEEVMALALLEFWVPQRYAAYVGERFIGGGRESFPAGVDPEVYEVWRAALHPPGLPLHLSDRKSRKRRRRQLRPLRWSDYLYLNT